MGVESENRQKMRPIVSDTGPLLHLHEANLLELLGKAGEVHIPTMVDDEMSGLNARWRNLRPGWIFVKPLSPEETRQAGHLYHSGLLDYGEAEAIVLAKRIKPRWFLTDDAEARIFAGSLGLEVHGSLGMALWAAAAGHLKYKKALEAIDSLSGTSLWISKDILMQARSAVKTMFEKE